MSIENRYTLEVSKGDRLMLRKLLVSLGLLFALVVVMNPNPVGSNPNPVAQDGCDKDCGAG
jgi:hypothetical protein